LSASVIATATATAVLIAYKMQRTNAVWQTHLKVGALFADLLETLLDTLKTGRRCRRIDQHEGVSCGNGEASHGGELHVTGCVQNVHLQQTASNISNIFPRKEKTA